MELGQEPPEPPDERAFYERLRSKAETIARRETNDPAEIDDRAAEAVAAFFFHQLLNPGSLASEDAQDRFVHVVVRNKDIDGGRRWGVHLKHQDAIGRDMDEHPSMGFAPDVDAGFRQLRDTLFAAMATLKPYYEDILLMSLDGMSSADIGLELRKSTKRITNDLRLARIELQKHPAVSKYLKYRDFE